MADNFSADLPNGEGGTIRVKLPEYALEITQEKILNELKKQNRSNTETTDAVEDLLNATRDANRQSDRAEAEADRDREAQLNALRQINESVENQSTIMSGAGKFIVGAVAGIGTVAAALANVAMGVGRNVRELADVGVGFEATRGETTQLIADMQGLGLSTEATMQALKGFSGVVQGLGKTEFVNFQRAFLRVTSQGTDFGLAISESVAVLSEDLELRQRLGFLSKLDAVTAAQQSSELYKQQLDATKLLGVSIDRIRDSGKGLIENNAQVALSIMKTEKQLGTELGGKFINTVESVRGTLEGMKIDPNLANQMMNEMMDVQAFISDSGQELFRVLIAAGGGELTTTIRNINDAFRSGDKNRIESALTQMQQFPLQLGEFAKSMSTDELNQFKILLRTLGPLGDSLALSLGSAAESVQKLKDEADRPDRYPQIAKDATAFENAMTSLNGTIASLVTMTSSVMSVPFTVLAEMLTETGGVIEAFKESITNIRNAVVRTFFGITGTGEDLEQQIKTVSGDLGKKLGTSIKDVSNWIVKWVESFKSDDGSEGLSGTLEKLQIRVGEVWDKLKMFGDAISTILDKLSWFIGTEEVAVKDSEGNVKTDKEGNPLTKIEFDLTETLVKVFGAIVVVKAVSALFTAGITAALAGIGSAGGVAAATASVSRAGAALKGAGAFALAAVGLSQFADAIKTFEEVAASENTLEALGVATVAIGGFVTAITVAQAPIAAATPALIAVSLPLIAIGAAAAGIGLAADGIASLASVFVSSEKEKAESMAIRAKAIEDFVNQIPEDKLNTLGDAFLAFEEKVAKFAKTLGEDGLISDSGIDVDKLTELTDLLAGEGINRTRLTWYSDAITAIIKAYTAFANLNTTSLKNNLDVVKNIGTDFRQLSGEQLLAIISGTNGGNTGSFSTQAPTVAPTPQPQAITNIEQTTDVSTPRPQPPEKTLTELLQALVANNESQLKEAKNITNAIKDLTKEM